MATLAFLFGSLPGFVVFVCLLSILGLLFWLVRIYLFRPLGKMYRIDD